MSRQTHSNSNNNSLRAVREQLEESIILVSSQQQESLSPSTSATTTTTTTTSSSTTPITSIFLSACSDVNEEMDAFLHALHRCPTVKSIFFGTDFLMPMRPMIMHDDENNNNNNNSTILKFFTGLGTTHHLEVLRIQSSSRFHVEIIPGEALLPLLQQQQGGPPTSLSSSFPRTPSSFLKHLECQDMQLTSENVDFLASLCQSLRGHATLETLLLHNFFANNNKNYYWSDTNNSEQPDNILDDLLVTCATTMPALTTLEVTGCGCAAAHYVGLRPSSTVRLVSVEAIQTVFESSSSSSNSSLKRLHLSFLGFTDQHFEAIAGALAHNTTTTTLQNVALDYDDLQKAGFQSLMRAMERNTSITSLSLRSLHDIGVDGFAQVLRMLLQYNFTVTTLSVTASPAQQAEIDLYLRMNQAGRGRLLRDPSVTIHEWMEILARHSDDLDVTRHLLKEMPGLCSSHTVHDDPSLGRENGTKSL